MEPLSSVIYNFIKDMPIDDTVFSLLKLPFTYVLIVASVISHRVAPGDHTKFNPCPSIIFVVCLLEAILFCPSILEITPKPKRKKLS